ncbi:MAG: hypothetical protein HQ477_06950, partial [Chloroflexi bacterium]|nr:hypothetical protein [Chloroflexota bacterium]
GRSEKLSAEPVDVLAVSGEWPDRNATPTEAESMITWTDGKWPEVIDDNAPHSIYKEMFHQGATMVPRMLVTVERKTSNPLGVNPQSPPVQSRRTKQEKQPWKDLPTLEGNVEIEFLRQMYLGESIAPYRSLNSIEAIIPWDASHNRLLNSKSATAEGHTGLGHWLASSEAIWQKNQRGSLSLSEQIDYYGKLSAQFPIQPIRVAYAASGTNPNAAIIPGEGAIVEHALYWGAISTRNEAEYLLAILNSETARKRVEHLQSRGQWGARHFDKVVLSLAIPVFNPKIRLHKDLASAAKNAEAVAASVSLDEGINFVSARRRIREALHDAEVGVHIDELVSRLLG